MKKSIISIDKAIEINQANIKMLSNFCKGLKSNVKKLEKAKAKGKVNTDSFTEIGIDFKSYYVEKEKEDKI